MAAPEARLLVTRPAEGAVRDVAALRALGVPAEALPLIAIEAAADAGSLRAAWSELGRYALVMFVSGEAVRRFAAAGGRATPDGALATGPHSAFESRASGSAPATGGVGWPTVVRAAAPGPGTLRALLDAGVPAACCVAPEARAAVQDSEALWARLRDEDWRGRRVLIVAGEGGRDWFENTLLDAGAQVDRLIAYRRVAPKLDTGHIARLAAARAHPALWTWQFSSREAVAHLAQLAPGADWSGAQALAAHPRIEAAARAAGFGAIHAVGMTPSAVAAWWHGAGAAAR